MRTRYIFLFLIVFLHTSLMASCDLAVCCIVQNDAKWLAEWLEFHKLQGVQHFYLYDNNSADDLHEVLQPYLVRNEVTVLSWPYTYADGNHDEWWEIQTGAYRDCLMRFGSECTWLAVIDSDEFLFCPSGCTLPEFLKNYKNFAGVGVNWLCFGTADVEDIPEGKLMIEMLTRCAKPSKARHLLYKSIVQPQHVQDCYNPHFFIYKEGHFAVDAHFQPLQDRMRTSQVLLDKIRINHYWARTSRYMRETKIPNRQRRNPGLNPSLQWQMAESYNYTTDIAILQFVEPLRQMMFKPK